MKTKLIRSKNTVVVLLALAIIITGCKSNRSKLTGNWQVKSAHITDPAFGAYWNEISEKVDQHDYNQVNADYRKYKAMEDSLSEVSKKNNEFYLLSLYQFGDDGSAIIKRPTGEVKGNWVLEEGNDKMYVEITENGKLLERWQLNNSSLETPLFEKDHEFWADMNHGGPFVRYKAYNVSLVLKQKE